MKLIRSTKMGWGAWLSFAVIALICLASALASWIAPFSYDQQDVGRVLLAPNSVNWFGTDQLGRDLFSRVLFGARLSLAVGVVTALVSLLIGGIFGAISGWTGGLVDRILMRLVDVLQSIPSLVLLILMSVLVESFNFSADPEVKSLVGILISLSIVGWVSLARLVRAQVKQLKKTAYIESARAAGATDLRILVRHIAPNAVGPVIVMLAFQIPSNILFESFLSFLGLGFQPPLSSWGVLAADGWHARTDPHLIIFPGIALFITTLAFNVLGDGLREFFDR